MTQIFNHEYFNIGPPVALYQPQAVVSDRNGRSKTKTGALKTYMGRFSPKDPNMPIVIVGGIGTTADNLDYLALVERLNKLGYNNVFVVDWAPVLITTLTGYMISRRHIPFLAAMETQRQIVSKIGTDQPFIAIALSGGGVVMRFLIEHPGADVTDPSRAIVLDDYATALSGVPLSPLLYFEGWDASRPRPWFGDGKPDVAPCDRQRDPNECGGIGPRLLTPWGQRVKKLYMLTSPNNGTPSSSLENCVKLAWTDLPQKIEDWINIKLPALQPQWETSCNDLSLDAPFIRALGNIKPVGSSHIEYVAAGSDATDGLPYKLFPFPTKEIIIYPAPWDFYPASAVGNFGFDGVVPTESPWVRGASRLIVWDGDNGYADNSGYAVPKGTSVHHKCLVANLWLWNRLIEHLEGRFDNRTDGAVFGQLIYSREDAIL